MTAALIERRPPVTKSNKSEILFFALAALKDDVPELGSATTSIQAIEILRSRLEVEPESTKLHQRLEQFLNSHDN